MYIIYEGSGIMKETKRYHIEYKWILAAICFAIIFIGLGFGSGTKSLFPDEIAKALDISRSEVSLGESCRYIATAALNIFFGTLVAKFGPKKLISAGFTALTAAMLLYSYANNVALICLAGTLLGVGFAFSSTTIVGYLINMWHPERKGTVTGAVLAANGIGGALAIKIVGNIIDPSIVGSYRAAYKTIAVIFAVTLVLLILFMRDKVPETTPSVTKNTKKRGSDWEGLPFSVLLHKPFFWCALVCIFFTGFIIQGMTGISTMHCKDVGIDYSLLTTLVSISFIILATSKFLMGFLYDKAGLRFTASVCTALAAISTFLLASVKGNSLGVILTAIYMVVSALAVPLETVMLPIYAADLCGKHSYAKVLGIFVSVNTLGYALGAPLMNLCYDVTGSYAPILFISGIIMTAVLLLLQYVISASHKEQKNLQ